MAPFDSGFLREAVLQAWGQPKGRGVYLIFSPFISELKLLPCKPCSLPKCTSTFVS